MDRITAEIPLKASGSSRRYSRLTLEDGQTRIRVEGTDKDENAAFIALSRHFRSKGINVPEVLEVSVDGMSYIQEDLGGESLWDAVASGRERCAAMADDACYDTSEEELLAMAVRALPKIQFEGAAGLDFSVCYPEPSFCALTVDFDLNYFKYCFLKPYGIEFNEVLLQHDFESLKEDLLKEKAVGFMYRDFQTRNVMLRSGEPWFIDFQGGRKGPALYDLASFVYQARSCFPEKLKRRLVEEYARAASAYWPDIRENLDRRLPPFILFRCLQTLGAYGFRGLVQRKPHFLSSIPFALRQLSEVLKGDVLTLYPYLSSVLSSVRESGSVTAHPELVVDVLSFSYRKGLPEDPSGNGGGFVFDCRAIHNPGKYERFKCLTGKDRPVADFLEQGNEADAFLDHVFSLVDAHAAKFISRGFTHFQVAFGCTGGQHRSVYCAERTAAHLKEKFGVTVQLSHRESSNWPKV